MRSCKWCGTDLQENEQFCGQCGKLQPATEDNEHLPTLSFAEEQVTVFSEKLPTQMLRDQDVATIAANPSIHTDAENAPTFISVNNDLPTIRNSPLTPLPATPAQNTAETSENTEMRKLVALLGLGGADVATQLQPVSAPIAAATPELSTVPSVLGSPVLAAKAAPAALSLPVKIALVAVAAIVVISTGIVLTRRPALRANNGLDQANTITYGQSFALQGSGFIPGGKVKLNSKHKNNKKKVKHKKKKKQTELTVPAGTGMLQMLSVWQLLSFEEAAEDEIEIDSSGSFEVLIDIDQEWEPGPHEIEAAQDFYPFTATMTIFVESAPLTPKPEPTITPTATATPTPVFTPTPTPVKPTPTPFVPAPTPTPTPLPQPAVLCKVGGLDFGKVEAGQKKTGNISITNCGGQQLDWQATIAGHAAFTLNTKSGTLAPNQAGGISVSVDTYGLKEGTHQATVTITSNGGTQEVIVAVTIAAPKKPAQLCKITNVTIVQSAAYEKSKSAVVTFSNCGDEPLDWEAYLNDAPSWVTINKTSGTIPGGGTAKITVTVNFPGGTGDGTVVLIITSNGGNGESIISYSYSSPIS